MNLYLSPNWLHLTEGDATITKLGGRWFYLHEGDSSILRLKEWVYLREGSSWIVRLFGKHLCGTGWKMRLY
jgi:hypothetical protein